jgi:hypothetical protein
MLLALLASIDWEDSSVVFRRVLMILQVTYRSAWEINATWDEPGGAGVGRLSTALL